VEEAKPRRPGQQRAGEDPTPAVMVSPVVAAVPREEEDKGILGAPAVAVARSWWWRWHQQSIFPPPPLVPPLWSSSNAEEEEEEEPPKAATDDAARRWPPAAKKRDATSDDADADEEQAEPLIWFGNLLCFALAVAVLGRPGGFWLLFGAIGELLAG